MSIRRDLFFAVGLVSFFALGGCASTSTLTSAAALAKAGQTAANQMEQNASISSSSLSSLKKAVAFNDGYNKAIGNQDSQEFLKNVTAMQRKMAAYGKMLESLASAYSALSDMASYDASTSFNSSLESLSKDSNNFLKSVNSNIQISSEVSLGVGKAGDFIVTSYQAQRVRDASKLIEMVLNQIIPVLDNPNTKTLLVLGNKEISAQINQAAITGYSAGVYSYAPLLDDLGSSMGFKSSPSADSIVAKNRNLISGLSNVAVELACEQSDAVSAAYDKSLAALKALVPMHESLNNGATVNIGNISQIISELQTLATSIGKGK